MDCAHEPYDRGRRARALTPAVLIMCAFLVTLIVSVLLPPVVKPLLVRLGIMDVPNARSSHERPVIRGVGLAVLIAMIVGCCAALTLHSLTGGEVLTGGVAGDVQMLLTIAIASVACGLLGLSEDLHGVSVRTRSVLLLGIAVVVAVVLVHPTLLGGSGSFGWGVHWDRMAWPWWAQALLILYAVLFISSFINVANFMDGLNGISGFHAVIAGVTFAAIGHVTELSWLGVAGLVLAGAFLGFLPYNLTKPGAFLGDVGSYLLGGAIAVTSFAALMAGFPLLATIGPMVIYFGDVGVTLVKRMRKGHHWDEPHKEHVYQRIQQLGYSHATASAITATCTAVTSALGFVSLYANGWGQLGLFIAGLLTLLGYLRLPRMLPPRVATGRALS